MLRKQTSQSGGKAALTCSYVKSHKVPIMCGYAVRWRGNTLDDRATVPKLRLLLYWPMAVPLCGLEGRGEKELNRVGKTRPRIQRTRW